MSREKIKWHPAFAAAIQLELKEYKEHLDFSIEHGLTDEPLKIDVVVIKMLQSIEIQKSIGKIFRKYNIFEYKSPTDYISIDDYYKVKSYAYLYKVLSKGTNSIDLDEITISLTAAKYPKKLVEYLESKGSVVEKHSSGIYYIIGTDVRTQILVTKELSDEESAYLKLLQFEHRNERILLKWICEYIENTKNPLYSVIMDVLAESSPNEILEVYRNMGVANVSENNKAFLMDVVKKLEIDKKIKKEEQIKIAKNLLDILDVKMIAEKTGLTIEEVEQLKK